MLRRVKTESKDEKRKYKRRVHEKEERKASHFDCLVVSRLSLACRPSSSVKTKNPGIWDTCKPALLWTMTQGANFKYADWFIYSFSQSRRWSSFSATASLSPFSIAGYYILIL